MRLALGWRVSPAETLQVTLSVRYCSGGEYRRDVMDVCHGVCRSVGLLDDLEFFALDGSFTGSMSG